MTLTREVMDGAAALDDGSTYPVGELAARDGVIERRLAAASAIDREARTVELSFSSEAALEDFPGIAHILDHGADSVDMTRLRDGAAVLLNHDPARHVGVVERAWVDGATRKGRAVVRFGTSPAANDAFEDVVGGIRRHVSVGVDLSDAIAERDPTSTSDVQVFRVRNWRPTEITIASVPRDTSVGIGRSHTDTRRHTTMPDQDKNTAEFAEALERARAEGRAQGEGDRVAVERRFYEVGEQYECPDLAREYLTTGKTSDEDYVLFQKAAVDLYFKRGEEKLEQAAKASEGDAISFLGMEDGDKKRYSLSRALTAILENNPKAAEFELHCSNLIRDSIDREPNGIFVPYEVQTRAFDRSARAQTVKDGIRRVMDTGTGGSGAEIVGTRYSPENFIELLRNSVIAMALGGRMLPGQRQNLDIPIKTAPASFTWLAEGGSAVLSDLGTALLPLTPKTVAGGVESTRRLLKQSIPMVDDMIFEDLAEGAAEAIDLGIMEGSGTGNEPTGITATTGVNTQAVATPGSPTFAETIGFQSAVAADNAERGSLGFGTTTTVQYNMKQIPLDPGSGRFVIDPHDQSNSVLGRRSLASNALSANRIIYGNWAEVLLAMWGVLDLRPDPYTSAASDGLIIRAFQDIDVGVRHAVSFCINA